MNKAKEHDLEQKLEVRAKANEWRMVANALYARAIFKDVICRFGWEEEPLSVIAQDLSTLQIPHVRGEDRRWTDKDVSRLLARVAALADDADSPETWAAKMQGFEHDLGVG